MRNWWSTVEPTMFEGEPLGINNYMSRTRFEGVLLSLHYIDRNCV